MLTARSAALVAALAALLAGGAAVPQELAIAPRFENAGTFYVGLAPVQLGGQWGLVNTAGEFTNDPVFDAIRKGEDERWGGRLDGLWRIFSINRDELPTPPISDFKPYRTGLAAIRVGVDWLMIDPAGWPRTPPIFLEIADWEDNIIIARDQEGWAYFDLNEPDQNRRRNAFYDEVTGAPRIAERAIVLPTADGYALLDLTPPFRRTLLTAQRFIAPMSEGMAVVQGADGRWGFFHRNSHEVLWKGRFDGAREFSQGFAPVRIGGKWGYMNRIGELVVEPLYDDAYPFRNGYATMRQGDLRGFLRLGADGRIEDYVAPQFEDVYRFVDGYAPVKIDGLWGYLWDGGASLQLTDIGLTEVLP